MANKARGEHVMVPLNLHVPDDVIIDAEKQARERGVSRAQVIREWIKIGRRVSDKVI